MDERRKLVSRKGAQWPIEIWKGGPMVNKRTLDYFYVLVQQRLNVGDDLNQSSCTVSEKYVKRQIWHCWPKL